MVALTTNQAIFIGTVLEGFVYGIYCLTFLSYLNLQDPKRAARNLIYPLAAMFILCTSFWLIDFTQQFLNIFQNSPNVLRPDNSGVTLILNDVTTAIYVFVDTISQCVLIYRCWVMWGKNQWLLIVPSVLTVTSFATGITIIVENAKPELPEWLIRFGVASFSISLAVNTVITGLLILKLVLLLRESSFERTRSILRRLIPLMLETGFLTFIGQLTLVVLIKLENPGFNTVFGPLTMLYGLTPTIVMVRVALGRAYEPGSTITSVLENTMDFATRSDPAGSTTILGIGKQDKHIIF